MAYQNVGKPRFFIDNYQYLRNLGLDPEEYMVDYNKSKNIINMLQNYMKIMKKRREIIDSSIEGISLIYNMSSLELTPQHLIFTVVPVSSITSITQYSLLFFVFFLY